MIKNYLILNCVVFSFLMISVKVFSQEKQKVISLYENKAPGSENWNYSETETKSKTFIYNISKPTLTVYKPDSKTANGIGVIVCPGGAFQFLSIVTEGYEVAESLQKRGYTVFLLKYRLAQCFTTNPMKESYERMKDWKQYGELIKPIIPLAIADGKQAIAYVKEHTSEYNLNKNKIGIMGFSAGGEVALGCAFQYDEKSRPDFVVPVYARTTEFNTVEIPKDVPPLFMTAAADDAFHQDIASVQMYIRWIQAKKTAELHIYRNGGHGFGVSKNLIAGTWIDRFNEWINGLN